MIPCRNQPRRGTSPAEVLIVVAIVGVVALMALMALPRNRESARLASCNRNLSQIGQAIAYYDGAFGHLPAIPPAGQPGPGPLSAVLGGLGLDDFSHLPDPKRKPTFTPLTGAPSEHVVHGFLCPSDPNVFTSDFPAPVSYRGDAGSSAEGLDGPFALGRRMSLAAVESSVGTDYSIGFAKRLIGGGRAPFSPMNDYSLVPGPVGSAPCPEPSSDLGRGDAGESWARAGWQSTLFNHALRPGESPSCIASDGQTARMGTSSGHDRRVNTLMLGGSVRGFTPDVDPTVWRKFGAVAREGMKVDVE